MSASRLAVTDVRGMALAALPPMEGEASSEVEAGDLFVRGVLSGRVTDRGDRPVAYGLHVGAGAEMEVRRAVLAEGGFGFFVSGGALTLTEGLVRGHLDAAGAQRAAADERLTLRDVELRGNSTDEVVELGLPSGTALPEPSPVCFEDC